MRSDFSRGDFSNYLINVFQVNSFLLLVVSLFRFYFKINKKRRYL